MKHILTEEDLQNNPLLVSLDCKAGDEIEKGENLSITTTLANDADDTGGTNPPPDKERPDKP